MCLGVPGLVVERLPENDGLAFGLVEFAGLRRRVCLACVPEAGPGDYVIVHAGIAISQLDEHEANRLLGQLRELGDLDGWDGAEGSGKEGRHEAR